MVPTPLRVRSARPDTKSRPRFPRTCPACPNHASGVSAGRVPLRSYARLQDLCPAWSRDAPLRHPRLWPATSTPSPTRDSSPGRSAGRLGSGLGILTFAGLVLVLGSAALPASARSLLPGWASPVEPNATTQQINVCNRVSRHLAVRVTPILKRVQALGGYGTWPLMARPGARRAARGGCLVGAGDGPRNPQRSASGCCASFRAEPPGPSPAWSSMACWRLRRPNTTDQPSSTA